MLYNNKSLVCTFCILYLECAEIKREITRMYLNSVWRDRYCGKIFPQIDLQIDEMEEEEKEGKCSKMIHM